MESDSAEIIIDVMLFCSMTHFRDGVADRQFAGCPIFKKSLKIAESSDGNIFGTEMFLKVFVVDCQCVDTDNFRIF